jgi:hypothetical protein
MTTIRTSLLPLRRREVHGFRSMGLEYHILSYDLYTRAECRCLLGVIFDRSSRCCLPAHVRFAPESGPKAGLETRACGSVEIGHRPVFRAGGFTRVFEIAAFERRPPGLVDQEAHFVAVASIPVKLCNCFCRRPIELRGDRRASRTSVACSLHQEKGSCSDRADLEGTNVYCRRSKTRATWVAVQECPPRAVGTPRSLSARAIAQSVSTPLCCRSRIIGRRSAARSLARLTWTARPVALACSDNAVPRLPPRSFPRAFAAASAAFVLLEISPASSSATAAICCKMKRPVGPSIAVDRQSGRPHQLPEGARECSRTL